MDKELDDICEKCNCVCFTTRFQRNFKNWTSGNSNIDKLIQDAQLSVHNRYSLNNALEWIPYNRFYNVEYITEEGFGKVYRANWIDGCIIKWDDENKNWNRKDQDVSMVLISLNSTKNITSEFINEVNFLFYHLMKFSGDLLY